MCGTTRWVGTVVVVVEPWDEDAPAAAAVAADAADLLTAATAGSVGYPGLSDVGDVEEVVQELARLAGQLREAATQLGSYLEDQLTHDDLTTAHAGYRNPGQAVDVARAALGEVHDRAAQMVEALNAAEQAMLEVKPVIHS